MFCVCTFISVFTLAWLRCVRAARRQRGHIIPGNHHLHLETVVVCGRAEQSVITCQAILGLVILFLFFLWWPLSVTLISPARLAPVPTLPVPTWTPAGPLHRFALSSLHPHLHSPLTAADWLSCQRPYYTKPPVELAEVSFSLSLALCKANQWHLTEAGTGIFHLTLEKLALFLLDFGHERRRQLFDSLGSETWELFFQDSASYG